MKVNDVVRIVKSPENQHCGPHLVGLVGFILEIDGEWANVQAITVMGSSAGAGTIPVNCLMPVKEKKWLEARDKHLAWLKRIEKRSQEIGAKQQVMVKQLAVMYGISEEVVEKIHEALASVNY